MYQQPQAQQHAQMTQQYRPQEAQGGVDDDAEGEQDYANG